VSQLPSFLAHSDLVNTVTYVNVSLITLGVSNVQESKLWVTAGRHFGP
jgi:hypothetical protein